MSQQEKLSELYRKTQRKQAATQEMAEAKAKHANLVLWEAKYSQVLASESADVEKLDKASLENLFYSITGKMKEKRAKEVSEAADAQSKYDTVLAEIKAAEDEIGYLKYELRTLGNCDLDYESLKKEMIDTLISSQTEISPKVELLVQQMNQAGTDADELATVIEAGKAAQKIALELHEELRKSQRLAHNYGRRGGSHGIIVDELLTHMENQEYLRAGQEILDRLKRQLDRYHTALYPLPQFGNLATLENLLCGRTRGGKEPIDSSVVEVEKMMDALEHSRVLLERIRTSKLDAQKRFDEELTELLISQSSDM